MASNDMVFDANGDPAFCGSSDDTVKWIRSRLMFSPDSIKGYQVRTGWPQRFFSVHAYLRKNEKT